MTDRRSGSAEADLEGSAATPRGRVARPRTMQTLAPTARHDDAHPRTSSTPPVEPPASLLVDTHLPPGGALAANVREAPLAADPFSEGARSTPTPVSAARTGRRGDRTTPDDHDAIEYPVTLTIQSLRADAKVVISLRDDRPTTWSEGHSRGLIGFSLSSQRDPAIYMRTFLVNARDIYLQSYRACEEIRCQLFVRTGDSQLRGRVDLPPGTILTVQTGIDRTSVVGLSSFAVALPQIGRGDGR